MWATFDVIQDIHKYYGTKFRENICKEKLCSVLSSIIRLQPHEYSHLRMSLNVSDQKQIENSCHEWKKKKKKEDSLLTKIPGHRKRRRKQSIIMIWFEKTDITITNGIVMDSVRMEVRAPVRREDFDKGIFLK